ncbi:methyl-accepting chemotaxis protein [Halobacillus locisalis]|nr:methyl-accepting chemotaxis protein [Halobacillus locisalis]
MKNKWSAIFTKSLKRQILIPFLTLILVSTIVIGVVSYLYSVSLTTEKLVESVEEQTKIINDAMNNGVSKDGLVAVTENVEIGETGYAAIISDSGAFVYHPDENYINEDITESEYYQKIMAHGERSGTVRYGFEGQEKTLGFTINEQTGWIFIGTVYLSELEADAFPIIYPIMISLAVVILISVMISLLVARGITNPIKTLQLKAKEISSGDLTVDLQQDRQDEIGRLSVSVQEMKESLKHLLGNVSMATEQLSSQSEELAQSSSEVRTGSEQIATTMQELASGSESQANVTMELTELMKNFANKIEQANERGKSVQDASTQVLNMTEEGSASMRTSVEQMDTIDAIVKESVAKVQGLDSQSKEISKMVQVIQDIAEQTNLLALNAAIEAARAGEHGKGFAVVADEVRKLAEQVSHSVGDITGVVNNIQTESNEVVQSLQKGYEEVSQGTQQINDTNKTFSHIKQSVTTMASDIQRITENLENVTMDSQTMANSVEEIASVSEESAAGIEQTSASAQQSASSLEEVTNSSSELSKLAEDLQTEVGKFKY